MMGTCSIETGPGKGLDEGVALSWLRLYGLVGRSVGHNDKEKVLVE